MSMPTRRDSRLSPTPNRSDSATVPQSDVPHESPSLIAERQMDAECRRFEKAWQESAGGPTAPNFGEWLRDLPHITTELLRELVLLDAYYRRKRGMAIDASEYDRAHPQFDPRWLNDEQNSWSPLPPRNIGDYELVSEIARGGMGVIYKARHTRLRRIVALKTILGGHMATQPDVERFQTEARAAAKLDHPHIVPIYDVGEYGGLHFFTMRLIEGADLSKLLERFRGHPRAAARIMLQVGEAVAHAHSMGVLHRDLKPANVLLDGDPDGPLDELTPYVTDFGLAKHLEDDGGKTRTHEFLGTPSYMAPEQAAGNSRQISTATDVYALGAILRALLTGRPPFVTTGLSDLLHQIQHQEPKSVREINRLVPVDLETVCDTSMRKDPARRYATAAAFVDDLQAFLQGRPIAARKIGATERVTKWIRRHPLPTAFVVALAILATVFVTAISWQWREAVAARLQSDRRAKSEGEANIRTQEALKKLNLTNYYQAIARAALEHDSNNASVARVTLDNCDPDLRGWEWHYLKTLLEAPLFTRSMSGASATAIAFSPNGRQVAIGQGLGMTQDKRPRSFGAAPVCVTLMDIESGTPISTFTGVREQVRDLLFSPDGRTLYASSGHYERPQSGELIAWDIASGKVDWHVQDEGLEVVWDMALSPDGSTLALGNGKLLLLKDTDGQSAFRSIPFPMHVHAMAFRPDGKEIAVSQQDRLAIIDVDTGSQVTTFANLPGQDIRSIEWHPVARQLAVGFFSGHGVLLDLDTGSCQTMLVPDSSHWSSIAARYALRGRILAMSRADGSIYLWPMTSKGELSSRTPRVLRGHSGGRGGVAVSPSGNLLAVSSLDGAVQFWDVGREPPPIPEKLSGGRIEAFANSVDGQTTVSAGHFLESRGEEGCLAAWNQANGQFIKILESRKGGYSSVAVNRNNLLAYDCGHQIKIRQPLERPESDVSGNPERTSDAVPAPAVDWREWITLDGHAGDITSLAFHPTQDMLASAGQDGRVKLWRWHTKDSTAQVELVAETTDPQAVTSCLRFSPGGTYLISCNSAGEITVRDPVTLQAKLKQRCHSAPIISLATHPKRPQFVTGDQVGEIHIWELLENSGGTPAIVTRHSFVAHSQRVRDLTYSPDGLRIASTGDDPIVILWDSETALPTLTLRRFAKLPRCVIFSGDGNQLLVGIESWLVSFSRTESADDRQRRVLAWRDAESRSPPASSATSRSTPAKSVSAEALVKRAWRLAEARKWEEAKLLSDQAAALKDLSGSLMGVGFSQSWMRMAFGEKDEVHKMCNRLLDQFEHDPNQKTRYLCGVVCGYRPSNVTQPMRMVAMLDEALQKAPEKIYIWEVLGVAHLRAGQWDEAIEAARHHRKLEPRSHGIDFFVEAMAHSRLGQVEEAKAAYRQGIAYFERDGAYERRSGTRLLDYRSFSNEAAAELKALEDLESAPMTPTEAEIAK